jgi:hypothetical protein
MFATFFIQEFGLTKFGLRLGPTAQFINFPNAIITRYQLVTAVSIFLCFCINYGFCFTVEIQEY